MKVKGREVHARRLGGEATEGCVGECDEVIQEGAGRSCVDDLT